MKKHQPDAWSILQFHLPEEPIFLELIKYLNRTFWRMVNISAPFQQKTIAIGLPIKQPTSGKITC